MTTATATADAINILSRAITAANLSQRQFALQVFGVDERTIRKWMNDDRGIPVNVVIMSQMIIDRPAIAEEMIAVHARLVEMGLV